MAAIFQRELQSYFHTMVGWVFVAFMLAFIGFFLMMYNLNMGYGNFEYVLSSLTFVFLIATPLLTMRCFADERRQKTDQLLYSLPLSSTKIVLGKYAAMLVVLAVPMLVSCTYPLILSMFGSIHTPTAYAAIGAFFLMGAALTALGMFVSTLCESQVTAAVACFVLVLANYLFTTISSYAPGDAVGTFIVLTLAIICVVVGLCALTKNGLFSAVVGVVLEAALVATLVVDSSLLENLIPNLLSGLSLFDRFSPFVSGVLDLNSVVFYLAVCAVFIFLAVNSFEKRRWS